MSKKECAKWAALISVIFGKSSMFVYACELFGDGDIYPVAIPVEVLKTTGLDWFTKLYNKHGKAQSEIIKGLLNLMAVERSITWLTPIKEQELIDIKAKYNLANYGYALEYYYVDKGCKHGDIDDDKTNKRDVYIKHNWTGVRQSIRGCQLKCSIRQSSVNF